MAFIRAIEVSTLFFFNESSYSSYCRIKSSAAVISPSSRYIFARYLLASFLQYSVNSYVID